jgi:hypothetical protein
MADHVSSLADIVGTFDKPKVARQREEWRQKSRPNPLFAPLKGRMLRHRFPEHCRTPPGNPPRPRATALT